jgi:hypothetical protein
MILKFNTENIIDEFLFQIGYCYSKEPGLHKRFKNMKKFQIIYVNLNIMEMLEIKVVVLNNNYFIKNIFSEDDKYRINKKTFKNHLKQYKDNL